MKITARIVKTFEESDKLKAIVTACLDGQFLVTGIRIVDCKNGLAVFMPSVKNKNGEYRDTCFPITPECRERFNTAILNAYDEHLKATEREAG